MSRKYCNLIILLLTIFLLTTDTITLQHPIVVAEYDINERQNYNEQEQNYNQQEQSYNQQDYNFNEYQNFQPIVKFDRPIVVKAIEKPKDQQDFSKIPGIPGVDYPLYHSVPSTSFSCAHVPFVPGMYANVETGCQAYHICHDGREGHQGASFLCTNGTLFNQQEFACDWWYNVNCADAPTLYRTPSIGRTFALS
ncbi:uncharacterized protein LOC113218599 isoform X2 [Apis mellifera]|uniref:Uncharacterized protein LOC113218599 isoform X2 n=1 Tax=Apis mellifera TaxID=7460 RepID=A0A7M7L886_APIME|nr:uncharacterized protein LOC113218599 isoform X2 [Apis mellifera]|eukprot:XP_026294887.1 uncharacterized protein LOC113218599 isoform X2 [Apis mellifera]